MTKAILLVQGAWGSSASWTPVASHLRAMGHTVHVPSLTGLGERRHLYGGHVNLSTHVQDVIGAADAEGLDDFLLVAHSYGGMVATVVADRLAQRISGLVYLDAFVPADGQSACDLLGPEVTLANVAEAGNGDGIGVPPPARHASRVPEDLRHYMQNRSPQPIATLIERVHLSGAHEQLPRHYVSATVEQAPIFQRIYSALRSDPAWITSTIETGHMLQLEQPETVANIIAGKV